MCLCVIGTDREGESSCNSTAKICIEAELEEDVLHNNLTDTCQINDVVSVITEIGCF